MAESVRNRKSKWDVPSELQAPMILGHENTLPENADDSAKDNVLSNHFSVPFETKANAEMIHQEGSEADDFTRWPQYEHGSGMHMDLSKCSGMEVGNKDDSVKSYESLSGEQHAAAKELSRERDKSDQSLNQSFGADLYSCQELSKQPNYGTRVGNKDDSLKSYEPSSGEQHAAAKEEELSRARDVGDRSLDHSYGANISTGHDVWKRPSSSMEVGNKDYPMKSHEPFSGERAAAKEDHLGVARDKGDRSLNESYVVSPQPSRGSLDRSRSRSRSRDRGKGRSRSPSYSYRRGPPRIRSRSPPYGSRRGPERWPDRDRTRERGPIPCRDFAAGRCRRGSECKFQHEVNERRQSGRHYDCVAIDTRGGRFERERYSTSDSREQRSRFLDKCHDFFMGRCRRGSSCKYAHHEASADGGWSARDESRERSCDRRDGDQSSGRKLDLTRKLPCKFFPEGRCSRGESCRFSHEGLAPPDDISGYDDGLEAEGSGSKSQLTASFIAGPTQAQMFTPKPQILPLVPPMVLNPQVQQAVYSSLQNLPIPFAVPPHPNFNSGVPNLQVLPPPRIKQNYNLIPQHGLNHQNGNFTGQNYNFNVQNENLLQSVNPNGQQMLRAEPLKEQPPVLVSDNPITPKVVTSEQAAQITNLSASLAQFFGNASALTMMPAVNPISDATEPAKQDADGLPPGFERKDDNTPAPKSADAEEKAKEDRKDESAEPAAGTDGESKQGKDAKATKMFKSALVEFVKDVLKPSWKEGHLSKEAHKTIVKKVVEKVTGTIQGPNIPQTPEKIDIYLSHSKAKLTKLVQGYVEKYVKS